MLPNRDFSDVTLVSEDKEHPALSKLYSVRFEGRPCVVLLKPLFGQR